jgi:glucose/arabinose dehydrogenase
LLAILLIAGCSENEQQPTGNEKREISVDEPKNYKYEVLAENLEAPWSITKLDNTFYLTERTGSIIKVENEKTDRQSLKFEQEISTASEAGLLGFILAPDFSESHLAYAYYTYEDNSGQFNRIITLRLEDNVWREESLLLDKIPSGTYHHG